MRPNSSPSSSLFAFGSCALRRPRAVGAALTVAALVFGTALGAATKTIVVGGSDLLAPLLSAPVTEFNRDNPTPLALKLAGTLPALADLQADVTALAVVVLKPGAAPLDSGMRQVPLAYATVYFAVPPGSAVNQLTLDQAASIFGSGSGTSDARRWSDLGFTGVWSAKGISSHALVAPRSMSLELFRHIALRSPELRGSIVNHTQWPELAEQLSADDGAIALVSGPPPAGLKVNLVPIAANRGATAVTPTPESVHSGSYPLRLPFVLVFKPARRAEVFEAVRFLLSEEIAEALAKGDLVPVPREARNAALFELETQK